MKVRKKSTVKVPAFGKEDAFQTLSVINNWISNIDTKTSFALALLGVLLGFTFGNEAPNAFVRIMSEQTLMKMSACDIMAAASVICLYLVSFAALICLMLAIVARTKNLNTDASVFFFGAIGGKNLMQYKKELARKSEQEIMEDLEEQIHTNSKICMLKAKYYNIGMRLLFISAVLWFVCMMLRLI